MTLLQWLDRVPPCLVRFMAKKGRGRVGLSTRDIVKASGLAQSTVSVLSNRATWKGVAPETIDAFCRACGVDLFHLTKHFRSLRDKRHKMIFIRRSNLHSQRMYARIQKLLIKRIEDARAKH